MKIFESNELIESDSVIGFRSKRNIKDFGIHYHKFIELVYITDGSGIQIIDGARYAAEPGDMFFIGYGASHAFETKDGFTHVEIFFSPKLIEGGAVTAENALALLALSSFDDMRGDAAGGKITFSGEERREVEFIISSMLRENGKKTRLARTVIENYLNILFVKMIDAATASDGEITEDVLSKLKNYIDEHPEEHMTLTTLASKSFYNPSYLSRIFKNKFGTSPMEYLRSKRIDRAAELLAVGKMTVDEVMDAVGFSDRSAFYHNFQKRMGITPAEYRAKYKK